MNTLDKPEAYTQKQPQFGPQPLGPQPQTMGTCESIKEEDRYKNQIRQGPATVLLSDLYKLLKRNACEDLNHVLFRIKQIPESRNRSLAITHIEDALARLNAVD